MSRGAAYLDTSAFLKLIVREPESAALRRQLQRWPERVSAALLHTETVRALRRSGNGDLAGRARQLLAAVHLVHLDEPLLQRAGELDPVGMRSLDAIHLAAALSIGSGLGVVFAYDERLLEAAREHGLPAVSPSD